MPETTQTETIGETPPSVAEGFIKKDEVARRLKAGVRTIDEWMRRGLIPYYKLGHATRFKWSEVERQLAVMNQRNRRAC